MKQTTNLAILSLLIIMGSFSTIKAQHDAMFTQYMFNEMFINPAYTGNKEALSATLLHRQQWVNFPGRPVTTSFTMHGPLLNNKMGLGISVLNDKVGVLNRNLVYASYAYRLKVNEKSTISMGLMGGLENQMTRYGTLKVTDDPYAQSDPQFLQNTPTVSAPNFGAGFYYQSNTFYAGLSVPRMIDNHVKFSADGVTQETSGINPAKLTYYFTGGYLFNLSDDLKLRANTMIKTIYNSPAQVEIGANFLIRNLIWAGASYRHKSAVTGLLGVQVNKQFFACYSFDYDINDIQKYSQGTHEIVLNYLFSFTGKKVATPRYF